TRTGSPVLTRTGPGPGPPARVRPPHAPGYGTVVRAGSACRGERLVDPLGDPPPRGDVHPVGLCPGAYGGRVGSDLRLPVRLAGARPLAAGVHVGLERLPQFPGIGFIEVDLVRLAVESEGDRFRRFRAVDVVKESDHDLLRHEYRSLRATPLVRTSVMTCRYDAEMSAVRL